MAFRGSPFLPAPDVQLHWAPESYISPCFTHFKSNDATLRALTGTMKCLHEKQMAYDNLLQQAEMDKDEYARMKRELEDQIKALAVRTAEAERLYKLREQQLASRLAGTQQALDALARDHSNLQDTSIEQLKQLEEKVAQLQQACKDLEAERAELQHKLRDAEVTAQARREAERRVAELEVGIAATQARAKEWIRSITKQRDQANAARDQLLGRLLDTQRALADQTQKCQDARTDAKHLLLSNHQLTNSLNLERMINEPLRHTNHASTTLAHTMRSLGAPMVSDRSRMPLHGAADKLPPPALPDALIHAIRTSQAHHGVARVPGAVVQQQRYAPHSEQPDYPASTDGYSAADGTASSVHTSEVGHDSGTHGSADSFPAAAHTVYVAYSRGTAPMTPGQLSPVRLAQSQQATSAPVTPYARPEPEDIRAAGRPALTRLARAWATTTTTAGDPHPVYLDNPERFTPLYTSPKYANPSSACAAERPRSAGPQGRPLTQPPSPSALETLLLFAPGGAALLQGTLAAGDDTSPASSYRRPSDSMLRTYHESRRKTPQGVPSPIKARAVQSPAGGREVAAVRTPRSPAAKASPVFQGCSSPARPRTPKAAASPQQKYRTAARPVSAPRRRVSQFSSSTSSSDTSAYTMSSGSSSTINYAQPPIIG